MHVLCAVEDSLSGRHVANIAADVGRRLEADVTYVTGGPARHAAAVADVPHDLLVVGPAPPLSLSDVLPTSRRNRLLRRAHAPVMVVADDGAVQRYDHIVLAYDRTHAARGAAATAARLAARLDATISVVLPIVERRRSSHPKWHVERLASGDIQAAAEGEVIDLEFVRRVGRPARELARAVSQLKPTFVVVGAAGPSRWRGVHGSVGRDVLRRTRHPVVLVTT